MNQHLDPYDADRPLRLTCSCGQHASAAEHDAVAAGTDAVSTLRARSEESDFEERSRSFIEATLVKALFPQDAVRRSFLKAVGRRTAQAAIASALPVGALASLQAMAQERAPLEKRDLKIGFIPITCATPLIVAHPLGFYQREGLNVEVVRTAGWALIRDKMLNREYDATHFLSPMPLAISLGLGSTAVPMRVATIQNTNGQAITLAMRHRDRRDPRQWKGFRFAVPFVFSIHNFLLRYYVAEAGLDPDTDIQIRVVPPPEMVANLRAGNLDGFLGPDPFNQRAVFEEVGFLHLLTKDLWDGHPCCAFGTSAEFIQQNPNTFAALFRAVLTGAAMAREARNRELIARVISPQAYLNQPEVVVSQVLTGRFADGLGRVHNVADRIDFNPIPWHSMAIWMLTQMRRWGYIRGDVNYRQIAERVFLLTDARRHMAALGQRPPERDPSFTLMGRPFNPDRAEAYLNSFAIRRR
ncbi:MAG: nitrate ABC transporter substrate-binding protein [Comamonadaceae bacterium BICA1-1]|nr:MAG: nitrate ABC transporter substrate-binding protein [Comamonadaceae bacterium BICA1-1]